MTMKTQKFIKRIPAYMELFRWHLATLEGKISQQDMVAIRENYQALLNDLETAQDGLNDEARKALAGRVYCALGTAGDSQQAIAGTHSPLRQRMNSARALMAREKLIY